MKLRLVFDKEGKNCDVAGVKDMNMGEFKKACIEARQVPDDVELRDTWSIRNWEDEKNIPLESMKVFKEIANSCPDDKPVKVVIRRARKGDGDDDDDE